MNYLSKVLRSTIVTGIRVHCTNGSLLSTCIASLHPGHRLHRDRGLRDRRMLSGVLAEQRRYARHGRAGRQRFVRLHSERSSIGRAGCSLSRRSCRGGAGQIHSGGVQRSGYRQRTRFQCIPTRGVFRLGLLSTGALHRRRQHRIRRPHHSVVAVRRAHLGEQRHAGDRPLHCGGALLHRDGSGRP